MRLCQHTCRALLLVSLLVPALGWTQERVWHGTVVSLGPQGEATPDAGVEVRLHELDLTATTAPDGAFQLTLPDNVPAGWPVTLMVRKPGWQILTPLDGVALIPALPTESLSVQLLPVGSIELVQDREHIEKLLRDLADSPTRPTTPKGRPAPPNLSRAIHAWAERYGLNAKQVKAEVEQWITEVNAYVSDLYLLGLVALAEKRFRTASGLFTLSAEQQVRSLEPEGQTGRRVREQIGRDYRLAGHAQLYEPNLHAALASYKRALTHVTRAEAPHLWTLLQMDIGDAHAALGFLMGLAGEEQLQQAVLAYRQALDAEATRLLLPQQWAATQHHLSRVLRTQGEHTEGEVGVTRLAEAVDACRQALTIRTQATSPQQWVTTQHDLGHALFAQGFRLTGAASAARLAEAVVAYRQGLTLRTQATLPQRWAMTQHYVGRALRVQGQRTADEAGVALLAEAAATWRQTLAVYTRERMPQDWALMQHNLGLALADQGRRTPGEAGVALLAEAVAAGRQALEIDVASRYPQQWGVMQYEFGRALQAQGERTPGEAGVALLAEAVAAWRQALGVYTRVAQPQLWGDIHDTLGGALVTQGERTAGAAGAALLDEAVTLLQQALEVRTRDASPAAWAATTNNLGHALRVQGERTTGEARTALLTEAVATLQQALEVRPPTTLPQEWDRTLYNLAQAAFLAQDWSTAAASYAHILDLYPTHEEAYQRANWLYHEQLFAFATAFGLNKRWLERHPDDLSALSDFAEKHLTTGHLEEAAARFTTLLAREDLPPSTAAALRALTLPTLLGLGQAAQVPEALEALRAHLAAQPEAFSLAWGFAGVLHFIARDERLAAYRPWLRQMFEALQAETREGVLAGVLAAQQAWTLGADKTP